MHSAYNITVSYMSTLSTQQKVIYYGYLFYVLIRPFLDYRLCIFLSPSSCRAEYCTAINLHKKIIPSFQYYMVCDIFESRITASFFEACLIIVALNEFMRCVYFDYDSRYFTNNQQRSTGRYIPLSSAHFILSQLVYRT